MVADCWGCTASAAGVGCAKLDRFRCSSIAYQSGQQCVDRRLHPKQRKCRCVAVHVALADDMGTGCTHSTSKNSMKSAMYRLGSLWLQARYALFLPRKAGCLSPAVAFLCTFPCNVQHCSPRGVHSHVLGNLAQDSEGLRPVISTTAFKSSIRPGQPPHSEAAWAVGPKPHDPNLCLRGD